jgi:transposase InsO family protein
VAGLAHLGIKQLPVLRMADGAGRKRSLYAALGCCSRSVHLAVVTPKRAAAFLREAALAFPFRITHVLTGHGRCFSPPFGKVCAEPGAQYRHTRPYTPQTNGMAERFNGRIESEVPGITIYFHRDLEQLPRGFNAACDARRQRVLQGRMPNQVVAGRLAARRKPRGTGPSGQAGPSDIAKARIIVENAQDVSQPDT